MAKRRSSASASSPRKKARLDLPTDTPSLEISTDEGASLLTTSTSSPPSPSRREKRKRTDSDPTDGSLEESESGTSAKRARTQSPASETEHSRKPGFEPWPEWQDNPDFVPWPSAFDDPQSEAHIFYEDEHYTKELTAEAREFRKQATLALQGYLLCECGKYHQMDGRKPWHYPGMEPELDESDEERVQPGTGSSHPGRRREPFPSPELSDDEEADATGGDQLEIMPVSASEPSLASSVSPASVISGASNVSPTNSPATSPVSSSTTTEAQVSRQRSNTKRSARKLASQRQTRKKNKRKLQRGNADKSDKRQPRGRKSKTTSTIEEPVESRRSSRRAAGSQLWFLDNNGEACLVASSSR
ncbi:hypothetical protein TGAM01_v211089 [Trichoderma gamsii]|uniref:Uncharacterized protein n=1 Tax=Trichoderma gamsii TaxID=398673 RepID=A0A2P4Z6Y5_9HYPO|nr:hypothetical protein TGAM01_v211089 [Trichoderma gamsii]PON20045.1 hypothetical protein TGAM01_v211089 [Trichoderma gamsii]